MRLEAIADGWKNGADVNHVFAADNAGRSGTRASLDFPIHFDNLKEVK